MSRKRHAKTDGENKVEAPAVKTEAKVEAPAVKTEVVVDLSHLPTTEEETESSDDDDDDSCDSWGEDLTPEVSITSLC